MAAKTDRARSYLTALVLLFMTFCSLPGCHGPEKKKQPCICVMIRPIFNNYFEEMEKGLMEQAEKEKARIIPLIHDKSDESGQAELFDKKIAPEIDALIIVPEVEELSTKYLIPVIEKANKQGKPVIFMHARLQEEMMKEHGIHADCYIGSDKNLLGSLAARYLGKKLEGKGKVMILPGYEISNAGTNVRKEGFLQAMKEFPDMETIVAPPARWRKETAVSVCRKMFKNHPDIRGVFAMSDMMAIGVSEASILAGFKRPVIISNDGSREGLKAIEEGRIDATIAQNPERVGRLAVENALKLIRKEDVPPEIYIRNDVITKESMQRPFQFQ